MAKDLAIVLNNGSMNSAVVTAMASQRYRPIMIFADAAPATGPRQRAAYDQQVAHFKPYREYSVPITNAGGAPRQNMIAAADPGQGRHGPADARLVAAAFRGGAIGGTSPGCGDLSRHAGRPGDRRTGQGKRSFARFGTRWFRFHAGCPTWRF